MRYYIQSESLRNYPPVTYHAIDCEVHFCLNTLEAWSPPKYTKSRKWKCLINLHIWEKKSEEIFYHPLININLRFSGIIRISQEKGLTFFLWSGCIYNGNLPKPETNGKSWEFFLNQYGWKFEQEVSHICPNGPGSESRTINPNWLSWNCWESIQET